MYTRESNRDIFVRRGGTEIKPFKGGGGGDTLLKVVRQQQTDHHLKSHGCRRAPYIVGIATQVEKGIGRA